MNFLWSEVAKTHALVIWKKTTVLRIFILANSITLSLVGTWYGMQNEYLSLSHKLANYPPNKTPIKTHASIMLHASACAPRCARPPRLIISAGDGKVFYFFGRKNFKYNSGFSFVTKKSEHNYNFNEINYHLQEVVKLLAMAHSIVWRGKRDEHFCMNPICTNLWESWYSNSDPNPILHQSLLLKRWHLHDK